MNLKQIQKKIQSQLALLDQEEIIYDQTLVDVPIKNLVRPNYSSRQPSEANFKFLVETIMMVGFLGGIFIEGATNHVIDGWHRVEILKQLGLTTIPCYIIHCTAPMEKRLHLSLNTQVSKFDEEEFGFTFQEFELVDFGVPDDQSLDKPIEFEPKFKKPQKPEKDGFCRLLASIPKTAYDQLKAISKELSDENVSITLTTIIQNYYENFTTQQQDAD